MKNKPASLLVVPLGKALSGIPPSWCGRQMASNSSLSTGTVNAMCRPRNNKFKKDFLIMQQRRIGLSYFSVLQIF